MSDVRYLESLPDVRWQCPRGHFIAHADIHSYDVIDPSEYYGVRGCAEYKCRRCERLNVGPYMYFELPRLVQLRPGDIDEIAVERAIHGDAVRLNRAERRRVIAMLTERGCSAREIAERIRLSRREVFRYRARLREAA